MQEEGDVVYEGFVRIERIADNGEPFVSLRGTRAADQDGLYLLAVSVSLSGCKGTRTTMLKDGQKACRPRKEYSCALPRVLRTV